MMQARCELQGFVGAGTMIPKNFFCVSIGPHKLTKNHKAKTDQMIDYDEINHKQGRFGSNTEKL